MQRERERERERERKKYSFSRVSYFKCCYISFHLFFFLSLSFFVSSFFLGNFIFSIQAKCKRTSKFHLDSFLFYFSLLIEALCLKSWGEIITFVMTQSQGVCVCVCFNVNVSVRSGKGKKKFLFTNTLLLWPIISIREIVFTWMENFNSLGHFIFISFSTLSHFLMLHPFCNCLKSSRLAYVFYLFLCENFSKTMSERIFFTFSPLLLTITFFFFFLSRFQNAMNLKEYSEVEKIR